MAHRNYPLSVKESYSVVDSDGRLIAFCPQPGEAGEIANRLNKYQAKLKKEKAAKRAATAPRRSW